MTSERNPEKMKSRKIEASTRMVESFPVFIVEDGKIVPYAKVSCIGEGCDGAAEFVPVSYEDARTMAIACLAENVEAIRDAIDGGRERLEDLSNDFAEMAETMMAGPRDRKHDA